MYKPTKARISFLRCACLCCRGSGCALIFAPISEALWRTRFEWNNDSKINCDVIKGEDYTKEKSRTVESVLKSMHSKAKTSKQMEDADMESSNTPSYEQGKGSLDIS